ncbi:hypothetical protein NDJ14_07285 [Vibrio alginolyticus]|uniref:hypothetical protein n=1 Tax=Vibrio alginolyticus TaxID=663 RepID=UPI0021604768|nr:hypothetical protein [Vibrio alginolyticus]MCS0128884.1 hypothetical protein [Vibrio alginolyticus]MCS0156747.1 hypothetical protein [Vibrio alginolyticus]
MKPEVLQTIFNIIMLIGALMAAIGGFGAQYFGGKAAEVASKKAQEQLNSTIIEQSEQIKELGSQNIELTKLNAEMSKSIQNQTDELTSKGSYPFAQVSGGTDNGNKSQIEVFLVGQYAIPNLTIRVSVIPNYTDVSGLDLRVTGVNAPTLDVDTLRPLETKSFMVDTSTNETAVTLYFASNNRKWTQSIRIVKTDQGRQELSYVSDSDGTLLKSYVAPNFPKHNGKYIIWSNKTKEVGDI